MNLDELRSLLTSALDRAECAIAEADGIARRWSPPSDPDTAAIDVAEGAGPGAEDGYQRSSWLV